MNWLIFKDILLQPETGATIKRNSSNLRYEKITSYDWQFDSPNEAATELTRLTAQLIAWNDKKLKGANYE